MAKSLEVKQQEMLQRQKLRKRQQKPMTKSELIELLTKRVRESKTNAQAFASMTRQLAELKHWIKPAAATSKPFAPEETKSAEPTEQDIYQQVLAAEEARRNQANVPTHS